jgi:hypothetical protein
MTLLLVACLLIHTPFTAVADGTDAVPLEAGTEAPFDGILISPERVEELLGAEIERDELKVRMRTQERLHQIEVDEYQRALKLKWYQQPRVNQVAGFTLGIIVFGGAIWGAGQIND